MRKIFLFLLLIPFTGFGQFTDDFSDGDFTNNPAWSGMDTSFVINNGELQSNGPNTNGSTLADTLYLSTPSSITNNTEWSFLIDLHFNPTADNLVRVYLISNNPDLRNGLDGYYVEIGRSTNDTIKFYKQTGITSSLLFVGTTSFPSSGNVKVKVKVTRDLLGNWNVFSDVTGGINYISEGASFNDNTYTSTSFFGIYCRYKTDSRYDQYYFDNFYVGPIITDTISPAISSVVVASPTQLDVYFSEVVDNVTAETNTNYTVDNSVGNPVTALKDAANGALVHLTFSAAFSQAIIYTIIIDNVQDLNNNTMIADSSVFILYTPKEFDVVINEIMADPNPVVALPDLEWVELYNRTAYPVNMKNWKFGMGTTVKTIPDMTIAPHAYILFTTTSGQSAMSLYGTAYAITSFAVTNDGETLALYDSLDHIISSVPFTIDWYRDSYKEDGGWSLEQIDPMNPCGGAENWRASIGPLGGTPGAVNSVNASNPDNTIPELVRVSLISNNSIQVYFSEPMDSLYLMNTLNYSIDNSIGSPQSANPVAPDYTSVVLDFIPAIQVGTIYTITINDTLRDCVGNVLAASSSARFAIPQTPVQNDIVINELLSNPKDDGVDYVELYNRSSKVIDLKELVLSSYDTVAAALTDIENITNDGYLLFPAEFVVLTTNPSKVKEQYTTQNPNWFISMVSFPSYNNDDGIAVLSLKNQTGIIDMLTYTIDMEYALLSSTDGVSLERINYERPSTDKTNWHSAAETAGFGTPTYKNSQFSEGVAVEDPVSVSPEIFSPDNDGNNDVLNINYTLETPGYMLNVTIYDASGRLVRNLIKNVMLGTSGTFSWDGITDDNEKARIGIYVIYFEVFDLDGNVKHYKKSAVLASKL
jgi:hypothetical protein